MTRGMLGRSTWIVLWIAAASCARPQQPSPPRPAPSSGVAADIAYLASDLLAGREVGTAGGDTAAAFLVERYERMGVRGALDAPCGSSASCPSAYLQEFEVDGLRAENVLAVVEGADPALRAQYVVIGAHYDHLGRSVFGALDPGRGRRLRRGADDNASGTAALLELGRRFAARPAPTSVILAHFDAKERGLLGSEHFVSDPPIPLASIRLMLNLDMVGRSRGRPLVVDVGLASESLEALFVRVANEHELAIEFGDPVRARTDHATFARREVPAVALFTGFHEDYHRVSDTPEKLDLVGLARIIDYAEAIVRSAGGGDPG